MRLKSKSLLYILLRFFLGAVFIGSSWNKLIDPGGFSLVVENHQILPSFLVNLTAIILPWLELVCGVLLITGFKVMGSAFIIDMMLMVFIVMIVFNIFRGLDVSCGCFSNELVMTGNKWVSLARDLGLLAIGLWIFFLPGQVRWRHRLKI